MKNGDKITYISNDICVFDKYKTYTIINIHNDIITYVSYLDNYKKLWYIGCSYTMNKFITYNQYRKLKLNKINEKIC